MIKDSDKHTDSAYIDKLGGTVRAAEFFDVKPSSISEWRRTGLPKARKMYLRVMRPDFFGLSKSGKKETD